MVNIIIGLLILTAVVGAVIYIVKQKKNGVKCIGCSQAGCCSFKGKARNGCGCSSDRKGDNTGV